MGKFDEAATIHYRRMLLYLRELGIEPVVTLHHFTNPIWFSNIGGWTNRKAPAYFARYTEYCAEHFGDYVKWWVTINEPTIYVYMGYMIGHWPPFKINIISAIKAAINLSSAHKRAYQIIHQTNKSDRSYAAQKMVGIAHNIADYTAAHSYNLFERIAARIAKFFANDYFIYLTRGKQDFIGLNYYWQKIIHLKPWPVLSNNPKIERSDTDWEISPQGLLQVLRSLRKFRKPILITENGLADAKDTMRFNFIFNHILMVYAAISEGIDVRGYLYWSLLDNFEWEKGFDPRFGLIAINYTNQERTVRESAWQFSKIIKNNSIDLDDIRPVIEQNLSLYPKVLQRYLQRITRIKPKA